MSPWLILMRPILRDAGDKLGVLMTGKLSRDKLDEGDIGSTTFENVR